MDGKTRLALLCLFLTVVLSNPALARQPRLSGPTAPDFALPATAGARSDTLFLFAASGPGSYGSPGTDARGYTFDSTGGPVTAGWFGVDLTDPAGAWWQVASTDLCAGSGTDMSAALPFDMGDLVNDYALWCGRAGACDWVHDMGYGNGWNQTAVIDLTDQSVMDTLRVEFAYRADFEGDAYDFFTLLVDVGGSWQTVLTNDVTGEQSFHAYDLAIPVEELGDGTGLRLGFHFHSDGGWSDEDGGYTSDVGAVWLDNLRITVDGAQVFAADFEDGLEPARLSVETGGGAGSHAAVYAGLYAEDLCLQNLTGAWAFFDLETSNPEYPIPVIAYGPPYVDEDVESPLLEVDSTGAPLAFGDQDQLLVQRWVYYDLPASSYLATRQPAVAARTSDGCLHGFEQPQTLFMDGSKQWREETIDVTGALRTSAAGGTITGVKVRAGGVLDAVEIWGGASPAHTPGPFYDNLRVCVTQAPPATWTLRDALRFQDSFPAVSGHVRLDPALDLQPAGSATLVVGDSLVVELDMTASGGLAETYNDLAGEPRPALTLYWRVVAGPHAGMVEQAQADPDAADGVWSPWTGAHTLIGDTWGGMQAAVASAGAYAFDFADAYFEPGDVVEYFFLARSTLSTESTLPATALDADPVAREFYHVRCLPTAGGHVLLVEDADDVHEAWSAALEVSGCPSYDLYVTLAPTEGLNNGLGCRATAADLTGYGVIYWDSGDLSRYALNAPGGEQLCADTSLLEDWAAAVSADAILWVSGNGIATELAGSPALAQLLGAQRVLPGDDYFDVTGIAVPRIYATHPAFEVNGQQPYVFAEGGCPSLQHFDLVGTVGALAVESHAWQNDGGLSVVAGVLNMDPDGDGTNHNAQGANAWVLYTPFSYARVRDAGFPYIPGHAYSQFIPYQLACAFGGSLVQSWWCSTPADDVPAPVTTLAGAHPNPFNPKTTLRFSLAERQRATLRLYDLTGRRVRTLLDETRDAGDHAVDWNGRDDAGRRLASGIYLVRFEAAGVREEEKLILIK